jgi:osmotically-inducible protein OsmY
MNSDSELRRDVERELEWEPSVDARRIGVSVVDGVVTLSGEVSTYAEKWTAERAVERVLGVRGVVNELTVELVGEYRDTDIARAAVEALKADVVIPSDRVKVKVEKGWVTLTGDVYGDFQRRSAERAVRNVPGVRGVANLITISTGAEPTTVRQKIEESFTRAAAIDARNIDVEVSGGEVTLRGTVRSFLERYEAEKAASAAPGVTAVHNQLTIEMPLTPVEAGSTA